MTIEHTVVSSGFLGFPGSTLLGCQYTRQYLHSFYTFLILYYRGFVSSQSGLGMTVTQQHVKSILHKIGCQIPIHKLPVCILDIAAVLQLAEADAAATKAAAEAAETLSTALASERASCQAVTERIRAEHASSHDALSQELEARCAAQDAAHAAAVAALKKEIAALRNAADDERGRAAAALTCGVAAAQTASAMEHEDVKAALQKELAALKEAISAHREEATAATRALTKARQGEADAVAEGESLRQRLRAMHENVEDLRGHCEELQMRCSRAEHDAEVAVADLERVRFWC